MNIRNNSLDIFFEKEIYNLDDEEIASHLLKYTDEEINVSLNTKLKILALQADTLIDDPWKLGVTFKSVKNSSVDKYILPKIYDANDNVKEAYFEFLCGFWEKLNLNQLPLIKEYSNYLVKLLPEPKFTHELLTVSIRVFVTAYIYNKTMCEKEKDICNDFKIVKNYVTETMPDNSLKEFILDSE